VGNSNYNALDLTLKHTRGRLSLLASYTYGKSLDDSSNLQEQMNPFNYRAEYGILAYDIKQNFVVSYKYELPVEKVLRWNNGWTGGWALSGITRFASIDEAGGPERRVPLRCAAQLKSIRDASDTAIGAVKDFCSCASLGNISEPK
jgi:hypothetical protein